MRILPQRNLKIPRFVCLDKVARFSITMAPSSALNSKRKAADGPLSPPRVRRAIQSGTTKKAVANFFTPASQKPKEKTTWTERSPADGVPGTMLIARYDTDKTEIKRTKIAAFDLDSTLITTSSGNKHSKNEADWKWWNPVVPGKLRELYDAGYLVVILSNQAGLTLHADPKSKAPKGQAEKRLSSFKSKANDILSSLDLPIMIYAATEKDRFRKPRTGMWEAMVSDAGIEDIDLENSFFIGDAGGRTLIQAGGVTIAKDFSCSDRNMAHNIGIEYKTPEEYFLNEAPRRFIREFDLSHYDFDSTAKGEDGDNMLLFEKKNDQELVIFCGPPGAGKSTFYKKTMEPLGYIRVNQDTLKTRDRCLQAARELLKEGKSVAIDNTNPDPEVRKLWIDLAAKHTVPIRCIWFSVPQIVCEHNDAVRALNKAMNPEKREILPKLAFTGFAARFKPPQTREGFQDVTEVAFKFRGTKEEFEIWSRYWM